MNLLQAEKELQKILESQTAKGAISGTELNQIVSVKNALDQLEKRLSESLPSRKKAFAAKSPPTPQLSPALQPSTPAEALDEFNKGCQLLTELIQSSEEAFKSILLRPSVESADLGRLTRAVLKVAAPILSVGLLIRNTKFSAFHLGDVLQEGGNVGVAFSTLENCHLDQNTDLTYLKLDASTKRALNGHLKLDDNYAHGSVLITLPEKFNYTETQAIFLFASDPQDEPAIRDFFESSILWPIASDLLFNLVKMHVDLDRKQLNTETLAHRALTIRNLFATSGVLLLEAIFASNPMTRITLRWATAPSERPESERDRLVYPLVDTEWEVVSVIDPERVIDPEHLAKTREKMDFVFQSFLKWLREETYFSVMSLWRKDTCFIMHLSHLGVVTKLKVADDDRAFPRTALPPFSKGESLHHYLETALAQMIEETIHTKLYSVEATKSAELYYGRTKFVIGWLTPIDGHPVSDGPQFFVLGRPAKEIQHRGSLKIALNLAEELPMD